MCTLFCLLERRALYQRQSRCISSVLQKLYLIKAFALHIIIAKENTADG
jgi:hypothetical protein